MQDIVLQLLKGMEGLGNSSMTLDWTSPVPVFGDPKGAKVATLGLNPSSREFVDLAGKELDGQERRFPTLGSLRLENWRDASAHHAAEVSEACYTYFQHNPYNAWFKPLDELLCPTGTSYYCNPNSAVHLDLVPFATTERWSLLARRHREELEARAGNTLGRILRSSTISLVVLNGKSVVDALQRHAGTRFRRTIRTDWSLPRGNGSDVEGFSYVGSIDRILGVHLGKQISILGYNHNIQSSFGVTTDVRKAIQDWIGYEWRAMT